jgi:hypothetical protein
VSEVIARSVVRHIQPIDAADIFAPSDDLSDETLSGVYRDATAAVCRFDLPADMQWIEKATVDVRRQNGME